MKLKTIYEQVVQEGMLVDPRGIEQVENELKKTKTRYETISKQEKEYFDKETLKNPYGDTRILNGQEETEIKTMMVGIDIETPELLLADRLNNAKDGKEKIDLVLSHHPQGAAYANFYQVMDMQADIFNLAGVPINISEGLVQERKKQVARRIHAANHFRAIDAARLLNIPFMCAHTPADNHVVDHLTRLMEEKKPGTLQEIMAILDSIEEYTIAKKFSAGPHILLGSAQNRCGKILVDMTGGTEGPKKIIKNLAQAGVGTIIGMHMSEEHYEKIKEENINVIVAGHIASDTLGMNLLLDKIEKKSKIKILGCSGYKRIKR